MGEQKGDILFSGIRPTSGFLKRYTGDAQALLCLSRWSHSLPLTLVSQQCSLLMCDFTQAMKTSAHTPFTLLCNLAGARRMTEMVHVQVTWPSDMLHTALMPCRDSPCTGREGSAALLAELSVLLGSVRETLHAPSTDGALRARGRLCGAV